MSDADGDDRLEGNELLELLGSVALRLADADSLEETLQRVVDLADALVTDCDGVSMMLISAGGKVETPAFSSQVARDSDLAQYETGEGPCLDAIRHERTIMMADMTADARWPRYRERALELGVRSMMSLRLFVTGDTLGALDLYSSQVDAFDERQRIIAQVFAIHCSVAVKAALTVAGLERALRSRDVIGQAKGIIMARQHVTETMAFELLRHRSQLENIPVRELAERMVTTGEVPRAMDQGDG